MTRLSLVIGRAKIQSKTFDSKPLVLYHPSVHPSICPSIHLSIQPANNPPIMLVILKLRCIWKAAV